MQRFAQNPFHNPETRSFNSIQFNYRPTSISMHHNFSSPFGQSNKMPYQVKLVVAARN
jgi:hypothetical protein